MVVGDLGRGDAVAGGVEVHHGVAAVEFLPHRCEGRVGQGSARGRGGQGHAHDTRRVEDAVEFGQGRVDVRQRKHDKGQEAVGVAVHQVGVPVVDHACGRRGVIRIRQCARQRGGGDHLPVHTGLVHQGEAGLEFLVCVVGPEPALAAGGGDAGVGQEVQVVAG